MEAARQMIWLLLGGAVLAGEPTYELSELRGWLGRDLPAVQESLGATASVREGAGYQRTSGLTMVWNKAEHLGWIAYLEAGQVVLLHVQPLPDQDAHSAIRDALGEPELSLPSRASKKAVQWVWPDHGVAVSVEKDVTNFIDVFQPCTADDYQAQWYQEPDPFTK